ncbi:hypothetical protein GF407_08685 [candidate division KSB1 bacterium]|nr:hypothetical protein [candidate division KSB1 bacterium]
MMHPYRLACGHFEPRAREKQHNIARMIELAEQAAYHRCNLILFPELITTAYLPSKELKPLAEPLNGNTIQTLSNAALTLKISMAFGFAELDAEKNYRYNSLVVLDQKGELAGLYRKTHLWNTEKKWAEPGSEVSVFDLDGIRTCGWVCYDTRFPEIARLGALFGAELGLVPTAWLGPAEEWDLALRARALDNTMFVAGADLISKLPKCDCHGLSMIVDPRGRILARAEGDKQGIIYADLDPEILQKQKERVPLLKDRRTDLFDPLARD